LDRDELHVPEGADVDGELFLRRRVQPLGLHRCRTWCEHLRLRHAEPADDTDAPGGLRNGVVRPELRRAEPADADDASERRELQLYLRQSVAASFGAAPSGGQYY